MTDSYPIKNGDGTDRHARTDELREILCEVFDDIPVADEPEVVLLHGPDVVEIKRWRAMRLVSNSIDVENLAVDSRTFFIVEAIPREDGVAYFMEKIKGL